jgi:hypothetical protein
MDNGAIGKHVAVIFSFARPCVWLYGLLCRLLYGQLFFFCRQQLFCLFGGQASQSR